MSSVAPEPSSAESPPDDVQAVLQAAAEYQAAQLRSVEEQGTSWRLCTFYVGALAAYWATGRSYYQGLARNWAQAHDWEIKRPLDHNAHCSGQVFLELYLDDPAPERLHSTKDVFDRIMEDPRPGRVAWSPADALFMAPPTLARLGNVTDESAYFDFLARQFWDASDHLFDTEYRLYYRDERYIDQRTRNGWPVFWARGNGWVLAGIARILQYLPEDHPDHAAFVNHYRHLAASVASVQGRDGFWRASLLDPYEFPAPESSSTALFCYALAWGINAGYLPRRYYESIVIKAWEGLVEAVNEEGELGWVQAVGSRPGPVSKEDTGAYGVGALLLAGSELIHMHNLSEDDG